jgi:type IV fimbrial biogenesis protein FimT
MKRMPLRRIVVPRLRRCGARAPWTSASGVTLLELVMVITIIAILAVIGVPSYKYIGTSYRISSEANGLLGDLQFARAEAIKEGQTVTVCISTDGATCAAAPGGWQSGWIVFSDVADNQTFQTATQPPDTLLRVQPQFTGTDTFEGGVNAVTFSREGFALGLPNGGATLTLHDSTANPQWTRCLELNVIGIMSIQTNSMQASCV